VAFNYDRLGVVYSYLQEDAKAEASFKQSLQLDAHLSSSYFGLARAYQRDGKFSLALGAVDAALRLDGDNANYHNLKGQILMRLGKGEEAQKELAAATALLNASRERRHNELTEGALPSPELSVEPKVQ
jgi:Tfp pilus assembly protein PilF